MGIDLSERQLETAAMFQSEHGLEFPLIHASAEETRYFVPRSWALQWPCEDVWSVRKPA
ncbi:unannotated protein [freshwater metagenome]|uniref:Unannotated protein n=1 Tax=freshwater metagenome TaxID=449393 RepID=A0A6J5ZWD1_9ZZZZ